MLNPKKKDLRTKVKDEEEKHLPEEKELIKFLSNVALFGKLTRNERRNLVKYIYIRKFKIGEMIFKKNYPNVVFYILKEGELKVFLEKNDEELELNRLHPLDFFGEIGLFLDHSRTATVKAVEDSVLLAISKRDLRDFIARFPRAGVKILYKMGEILCNHVINLNKKINI
ncbi:MAG: cyclic nucleotide-binding domain-containing protein [Candidatus Cloacimonetes bacterium]|nr:cyclic nucleotide-binding domain-containing protein [Candidatus Cloacimonadota bacterium]